MRRFKSLLFDLCLIAVATVAALLLRDNLDFSPERFAALLPYLAISLVAAAIVLPLMGVDRTLWRFSGLADYWRLITCCAIVVFAAVMGSFAINRMENVARSIPILQGLTMIALLVGLRLSMRAHRFRHNRAQLTDPIPPGEAEEAVLVVGLNTVAELFLQAALEHATGRIRIAGVLGRNERQTGHLFRSHRILGVPEEIESILRDLEVHGVAVGRIVVALSFGQLSPLAQQALLDLEDGTDIKVDYFAERIGFEVRPAKAAADAPRREHKTVSTGMRIDDQALLASLRRPYWALKRGIDVVLASVAIGVTLPIMIAIGVITTVSFGFPALFWQQRPGRHARPFKVYKFRSLLSAHDGSGTRLPDSVRQTPFGRFLRATRLDELPQLFNILAGHMSFVGPRPLLLVDQLEQFKDRLLVRPGLTGWAQVNGGKSVSASDKMALDMWYIRNASVRLDAKIMLMTIRMVVTGERENPDAVERAWSELNDDEARRAA